MRANSTCQWTLRMLGFCVPSPPEKAVSVGRKTKDFPVLSMDHNGGTSSHTLADLQLKDQFSCGNDYPPKARKPYTITKQRERWTEEEHKKFLEALKMYGRAWRKIEEHVGTKTAVQIRSHAQKFFSKISRDQDGHNTCSVEPLEIPPPRPKRKPVHPYPRKLLHKETSIARHPTKSSSPNLSISDHENQSPKSVLSVMRSDSTNSNTQNGSLSPVSYGAGTSLATTTVALEDKVSTRETSAKKAPTQTLKLFGRTVLVTDSQRPSSPTLDTCKAQSPNVHDEKKHVERLAWNVAATESSIRNVEHTWSHSPQHLHMALHLMHCPGNESSNLVISGAATTLPWWSFYRGLPFHFMPINEEEQREGSVNFNNGKNRDEEVDQKEGSWTGSNSGSENDDKYSDTKEEKELDSACQLKPSSKPTCSELRKGFYPYKRCLAVGDSKSSTVTEEEREEKRTCLCL
ncbi:hypothetical protein FNV43_RR13968 [Rhamnella rubrinervis]|uniref:Uncharacterized protein n=1 Tax=Rhamnella rubrinervis TaxID=2594499 RepID=A0A8K0MFZ2_9ROSA|nr:hypothetical protein FNV43_RR13968 [Rhamnella rubrinervis]